MSNTAHVRKGAGTVLEQILSLPDQEYGKYGLCGGRGVCGKCRVRFLSDAPPPSFADRRRFAPEQLREGYRLACTARASVDCDLEICFEGGPQPEILTAAGEMAEGAPDRPGYETGRKALGGTPSFFIAADLGTTTVALQLVEKAGGGVLAEYAFLNPQRAYGVDVVSRIAAAQQGKAELLRGLIMDGLQDGLKKLRKASPPAAGAVFDSCEVILAGNTTMGHLLLGYPTQGLGRAPFTPWDIGTVSFELFGHPAVYLPGISAFIGADIVSGIYAYRMAEREELTMLLDLGTNGEIALGNRDGIVCSAAAAGSAFEGDVSAQALGSDITAIAFDMLRERVMDETGLLREPEFTQGYRAKGARIGQKEIRGLQMAKGAICAGVSILLDEADAWERLSRVYLAGGFGYYLDVGKAVAIGLLPAALEKKCRAVGNSSLAGAIRYGRTGKKEREEETARIVRASRSVNLAQKEAFADRYIEAMAFRRMERCR